MTIQLRFISIILINICYVSINAQHFEIEDTCNRSQGSLIEGKAEGYWEFYDSGCNRVFAGSFFMDFRVGEWFQYRQSGEIEAIGTYYNDSTDIRSYWRSKMRFENVSSSDSHDDGLDSAISRNEWNQGLDEIAASFGMDTSMYERDGPIITYGRCSPFRGICIRHGRWEYFDHAGKSSRIEKYENGKLVEVRDQ